MSVFAGILAILAISLSLACIILVSRRLLFHWYSRKLNMWFWDFRLDQGLRPYYILHKEES
jgi:hypothetical protein